MPAKEEREQGRGSTKQAKGGRRRDRCMKGRDKYARNSENDSLLKAPLTFFTFSLERTS